MTKGTPSRGKRQTQTHIVCRRCGKVSYHKRDKVCSSCGFGKTSRMRKYNWVTKKSKTPTH